MSEFEKWFNSEWGKFHGGILSDAPKHNAKLAWNHQQKKIDELEAQLKEAVEHIELGLDSYGDTSCRLDHNGNCQEHGWFDLEDGNCPVKLARQFLAKHKEKEE